MDESIFFASAWAEALSSIADKFPNIRTKTGIDAWYMVSDIKVTPVNDGILSDYKVEVYERVASV
jgi:predicted molibdopterin-dependent oxidoreductase YjgC